MAETKTAAKTTAAVGARKTGALSKAPPTMDLLQDPTATPAGLQKRNLIILGGALVLLWITAFASGSKLFVGIIAVLTLAVAGLLFWVWRWVQKQKSVLSIMQEATGGKESRAAAIAKLDAHDVGGKDVVSQLAKAQLVAQDDPDAAIEILEKIDIAKAPSPIQDEVRAMRAQLYLVRDRPRDARELADAITIANAQDPAARGMLAAVVAETWARTGKHKEAVDLLGTIDPDESAFEKVRVPLLMARVFAHFINGQRELARKDLRALMGENYNYLARFANPQSKVHPELQKMAREMLQKHPEVQKMAKQQQNRAARRAK
ncbi:MAG: tetratricopeptide repeat protein [Deltaproteobacteria bacterium]|nr:tetratricopeptide repeat protein [Deltaproteobacteria bacterium]